MRYLAGATRQLAAIGIAVTSISCTASPVQSTPVTLPSAVTPPTPAAPTTVTLSGVVHESAPTYSTTIRDATVVVTDSKGSIHRGTTDANGRFTLELAKGAATISATADGYDAVEKALADGATDVSIALMPAMKDVTEVFASTWGVKANVGRSVTFSIPVHRSGNFVPAHIWICVSGCLASELGMTRAELTDESGNILFKGVGFYDNGIVTKTAVPVVGGQIYTLKVYVEPSPQNWDIIYYYAAVTHPI